MNTQTQKPNYKVEKTYFRNGPRYGRTTTLLKNGVAVLVLMGVVSRRMAVTQYEGKV